MESYFVVRRVLIVGDEENIRKFIKINLEKINVAENIFKLSINIANKTKAYDSKNREIINYGNVIEGYYILYLLYKQSEQKSKEN